MGSKKQAVLLIHGVGFQRPMRTLRGFVDAVWVSDTSLRWDKVPAEAWSKPDTISESFELRRLTTSQNKNGVRTDFFEFYWAHLMQGTTLEQIAQWLRSLLLRNPARIPKPLRAAYVIVWIALLGIFAASWNAALPDGQRWWDTQPMLSALASILLLPALVWVLREYVGDAAVYLDAAPANIQRRHEIRTAGVRLLNVLHRRGYDRIIVVGHSLGSVIGYDILKYVWASMHDKVDGEIKQSTDVLHKLEADALRFATADPEDRDALAQRQRDYLQELRDAGHPWRVTDFVTLGSPLTYAPFLLAADQAEYARQIRDHELPACLPALETQRIKGKDEQHFSFEKTWQLQDGREVTRRVPHHAALFAPVVWTNLYFPSCALLRGDMIGGPVAPVLGSGVRDVKLANQLRGGWLLHTHYWTRTAGEKTDPHIEALRTAVDLGRAPGP